MATKSYSKHKEYREYSSSGSANVPGYTDEQFDMIKSDLLPKGSKLNSLDRNGGAGTREYHYEYKEEKHPSGKYDRKDLHTVELLPKGCKLERNSPGSREYCYDYEEKRPSGYGRNDPNDMFAVEEFTVPPRTVPKGSETSSYYYEREERDLPAVGGTRTYNYESSTSSTPGYSKVKSSKATKELSHNVEELDSLLDDLQKDQERQLYKSGYASDTAESTSFDYRKGTPVKPAPSSGYSTLKREEHIEKSSWSSSPPPPPAITRAAEVRQELYREEKTESRVIPSQVSPAVPIAVPPAVCHHCHHVANTGTLPRSSTPMNKVTTTVKTYTYEVPAGLDPAAVPLPAHAQHEHTYLSTEDNMRSSTLKSSSSPLPASPPAPGCAYCAHCSRHAGGVREYTTHITNTTDVTDRTNERMLYPAPANQTKLLPPTEPHNGHGPHGSGPATYKYSETSYSSSNTHEREYPRGRSAPSPSPSPSPFPRATTPSPGNQQTPKRLDDLLADFPEARFPTQPDGISRRKVEVTHESQQAQRDLSPSTKPVPAVGSKNVTGPPVYYPPGHTPFQKKDTPVAGGGYEASSAMSAGGGRYASGRGMYEYESGSRSKEKHSETKTAVPICLPLCCAMPCVIM